MGADLHTKVARNEKNKVVKRFESSLALSSSEVTLRSAEFVCDESNKVELETQSAEHHIPLSPPLPSYIPSTNILQHTTTYPTPPYPKITPSPMSINPQYHGGRKIQIEQSSVAINISIHAPTNQ